MIKINLAKTHETSVNQTSRSVFTYKILTVISIIMIIAITGSFVFAQSSKTQLVCREKAKEAAKTTYSNCMADAKEAELEKIREDYKKKMDQLKNYYDKKIKSLSPSSESPESVITPESIPTSSSTLKTPTTSKAAKTPKRITKLPPLKAKQKRERTERQQVTAPAAGPKVEMDFTQPTEQNSVKNNTNTATENPIIPYYDSNDQDVSAPPTLAPAETPAPEVQVIDTLDEDFR